MTLTESFRKYGAKLVNHQWAVSAISENNELVISCWSHHFVTTKGKMTYIDSLSRFGANSGNSRNLLEKHLVKAMEEALTIRLVIATSPKPKEVDSGDSGSHPGNTFFAKEDVQGRITKLDGDEFEIEFVQIC